MLVGVVAGIAGGAFLLVGLDLLRSTIKSVDNIKSLGLQVLAVVPKIPDRENEFREVRRNRILSACSALYLLLILGAIVIEAAGLPYLDNLFSRITSVLL
jgi:hypothetical protein